MLVSSSSSSLLLQHKQLCCPSACLPPPQQQRPSRDHTSKLRPDINPSVLRSLHGDQHAPSLIEKNLRKRAGAPQSPGDGDLQLAVSSPLADHARGFAADQVINSVFWDELPEDLALPNFMFLEVHARLYRSFFLFYVLKEADVSPTAALWFILPAHAISFDPPNLPPSLLLEWGNLRRSIAADLSRVAGGSRIYLQASPLYWKFWDDRKILDDKSISLTTALALILDVELLEFVRAAGGAEGGELASVEKRLGESSAALGGAMRELQKETMDPQAVWEKTLKGSSIASDGRVFVFEEALIFPVIRDSSADSAGNESGELAGAILQVEQRLEERYPSRVVLFLRSKTHRELFYVVIAPWYWFLFTNLDNVSALNYFLLPASFLATSQFAAADPGFSSSWIAWESAFVPLGWTAILASGIIAAKFMATKHRASSSLRSPVVFAFPHLGAVGRFSSFARIIPSRCILVDILLSGSCASLLVSALLLAFGFAFWGPSHFNSASTADFRGYLLVPPDLFSYSQVLTKLLNSASVALLKGEEDGRLALATSPFALAGLLGLNFMAFSLFPTAPKSDGTLLLKGLLGDATLAENVSIALSVLLAIAFFSKTPTLGICWLAYSFLSTSEHSYIKDEVSEPSFFKRIAGFVLIAAVVVCFVPVFQ